MVVRWSRRSGHKSCSQACSRVCLSKMTITSFSRLTCRRQRSGLGALFKVTAGLFRKCGEAMAGTASAASRASAKAQQQKSSNKRQASNTKSGTSGQPRQRRRRRRAVAGSAAARARAEEAQQPQQHEQQLKQQQQVRCAGVGAMALHRAVPGWGMGGHVRLAATGQRGQCGAGWCGGGGPSPRGRSCWSALRQWAAPACGTRTFF